MRALLIIVGVIVLALIAALVFGFIDVDQTQSAHLPEVEVNGGQAPEFNADVGRVDVGTEKRTIEVPTIDVQRANEVAPQPTATP